MCWGVFNLEKRVGGGGGGGTEWGKIAPLFPSLAPLFYRSEPTHPKKNKKKTTLIYMCGSAGCERELN